MSIEAPERQDISAERGRRVRKEKQTMLPDWRDSAKHLSLGTRIAAETVYLRRFIEVSVSKNVAPKDALVQAGNLLRVQDDVETNPKTAEVQETLASERNKLFHEAITWGTSKRKKLEKKSKREIQRYFDSNQKDLLDSHIKIVTDAFWQERDGKLTEEQEATAGLVYLGILLRTFEQDIRSRSNRELDKDFVLKEVTGMIDAYRTIQDFPNDEDKQREVLQGAAIENSEDYLHRVKSLLPTLEKNKSHLVEKARNWDIDNERNVLRQTYRRVKGHLGKSYLPFLYEDGLTHEMEKQMRKEWLITFGLNIGSKAAAVGGGFLTKDLHIFDGIQDQRILAAAIAISYAPVLVFLFMNGLASLRLLKERDISLSILAKWVRDKVSERTNSIKLQQAAAAGVILGENVLDEAIVLGTAVTAGLNQATDFLVGANVVGTPVYAIRQEVADALTVKRREPLVFSQRRTNHRFSEV